MEWYGLYYGTIIMEWIIWIILYGMDNMDMDYGNKGR